MTVQSQLTFTYGILATFIIEILNNMIRTSGFPDSLKQADIKPVYKKGFQEWKGKL